MSDILNLPADSQSWKVVGGRRTMTLGPYTLVAYTSGSGSFTIPSDVRVIRELLVVGGGGGGGSGWVAGGANPAQGGSGGGGGAYAYITNLLVQPNSTLSYSVGAGGTAPTSQSSGNPGSASSVTVSGLTFNCSGGSGGLVATSASATAVITGGSAGTYSLSGTLPAGAAVQSGGGKGGDAAAYDGLPAATAGAAGTNAFTYGVQNLGSSGGLVIADSPPGICISVGFAGGGGAGAAYPDGLFSFPPDATNGANGGGGGGGSSEAQQTSLIGGAGGAAGTNTGAGGGGGGAGRYNATGDVGRGGYGGNGAAGYVAFIY